MSDWKCVTPSAEASWSCGERGRNPGSGSEVLRAIWRGLSQEGGRIRHSAGGRIRLRVVKLGPVDRSASRDRPPTTARAQGSLKHVFMISARCTSVRLRPCHIARRSARQRRVRTTSSAVGRSGKSEFCVADASQRPTRSNSSNRRACSASRSGVRPSTRFSTSQSVSARPSSYQSSTWAFKWRAARTANRRDDTLGSASGAAGVSVVMAELCTAPVAQARTVRHAFSRSTCNNSTTNAAPAPRRLS